MPIRLLVFICLFTGTLAAQAKLWRVVEGRIAFTSDAPLELIESQLRVEAGRLYLQSSFTVPLTDHNIAVPHIVHQKIAVIGRMAAFILGSM